MHWESSFNTNLESYLTNCECLAHTGTRATDYNTLENLHTATVTFNDVYVDFDVISHAESWDIGL
jgi:hypothetical protein